MITIVENNFSLKQIGESGQCFRLEEIGEEQYSLVAFGRYLEAEQRGKEIRFSCREKEFEEIWKEYFDLDTDYGAVIHSVNEKDAYLCQAVSEGAGLRILRQDLWEMIISFIISQQNNIRRIRKCIDQLCRRYGEKKISETGKEFFAFPEPEALAKASLAELYDCGLGYRSRYISQTARSVTQGEVELDKVRRMDYEQARSELLGLCGVGEKVADCICLFALHHMDAFPRDVHINRVLAEQYPMGFPFESYRGYSGIIQQYIFYYDLKK